jgi:transcriptional regulator with XRE-family HTH domain
MRATGNATYDDLTVGRPDRHISPEAKALGANLARLRRARGVTQAQLAKKLGVLQPMVSDYELGKLRLHGLLIVKLAAVLGVSTDEILGVRSSGLAAGAIQQRFLRRLREVELLSTRDQQALLRTVEAFIRGQLRKSA